VLASCEESAAAIWSGAWALNDDDHLHADVVLSWPPGLPRKSLRLLCHRTQGVSPADSNRKTGCSVRPLPSGFSPEAPVSPSAQQANLAFVHMHLRIEPYSTPATIRMNSCSCRASSEVRCRASSDSFAATGDGTQPFPCAPCVRGNLWLADCPVPAAHVAISALITRWDRGRCEVQFSLQ